MKKDVYSSLFLCVFFIFERHKIIQIWWKLSIIAITRIPDLTDMRIEVQTSGKKGMDHVTVTGIISSKFYGTLQNRYAIYYPIVIIDCTRWGQVVYYMITQEKTSVNRLRSGLGLLSR